MREMKHRKEICSTAGRIRCHIQPCMLIATCRYQSYTFINFPFATANKKRRFPTIFEYLLYLNKYSHELMNHHAKFQMLRPEGMLFSM